MPREKLPAERQSFVRAFKLRYVDDDGKPQKLKFWVTAGLYADGRLAEIFVTGDKIGGLLSGTLDAVAVMISLGLQYGVPLAEITGKLRNQRFGPGGFTGDPEFPSCTSMFDYIAQWLNTKFPGGKLAPDTRIPPSDEPENALMRTLPRTFKRVADSPDDEGYETCLRCGKHISRHYGGVEGVDKSIPVTAEWPAYRCDPKPEGTP